MIFHDMKKVLFLLMLFVASMTVKGADDRPDVNTDESKVKPYTLPDALITNKGKKVATAREWEKDRRPELYDLFATEVYGKMPSGKYDEKFTVTAVDPDYAGGRATHKTIQATFSHKGRSREACFHLYIPNGVAKAPVFMYFSGEAKGDDPKLLRLLDAGYALCTGDNGEFFPDRKENPYAGSVLSLWGYDTEDKLPADCARALAVWAWGHSRALDYLESDPDVNASKVVVMGFSRGGKLAGWAAASDPRFAMAVINDSGCGGAALFRRKYGENAYRINTAFPYWFCENFHKYSLKNPSLPASQDNLNEDALPVDQHELIALIAPRPVYVGSGEDDSWSDPKGEFLGVANAGEVYALYGYSGIDTLEQPAVNHPVGDRVAYHVRSGGHAVKVFDWENYIRFADRWLKDKGDAERAIEAADVVRTDYNPGPQVYLYQGNGQFGTSVGPLGLHLRPEQKNSRWGKTMLLNLNHQGRGKFNQDYVVPMLEMYWGRNFETVSDYCQKQSYYNATITTTFKGDGVGYCVESWFDPVDKSLCVFTIYAGKGGAEVIVSPFEEIDIHYSQHLEPDVSISQVGNQWKIIMECLGKCSELYLTTNAAARIDGKKLVLTLMEGNNDIEIAYGKEVSTTVAKSLSQTKDWWHSRWNRSYLNIPEDKAQKTFVRSMAMFLSSYDDTKIGLGPPMGYTGNWWPGYYPQDVSYVHGALLPTGNLDIARSWIEYWAEPERIEGLRAYTRRLYGKEGLLAPWVYPYGSFEGYHVPSPPNKFFYEIHNSGYFARMAAETAAYVDDPEWTARYAKPILEGCAEFYSNIMTKGDDGKWHLYVYPSMGQDEQGGENQKDYLCASYSALYCLQQAVRHGLDKDGHYQQILDDGLGYVNQQSPLGFYYSSAGSGEKEFGRQKHPVQLNELAFLPVGTEASESAKVVYDRRYDITNGAKRPFFFGWTLGEFLLAGSRRGDVEGWKYDWANMEKSDYVDPEWIQIYETSGNTTTPFYNVTNGLVVQSLISNLVCDWYGRLELAKCNPWEGVVTLKGINSILGVSIDGEIEGKSYDVVMTAWKDADFILDGKQVTLRKGDKVKVSNK